MADGADENISGRRPFRAPERGSDGPLDRRPPLEITQTRATTVDRLKGQEGPRRINWQGLGEGTFGPPSLYQASAGPYAQVTAAKGSTDIASAAATSIGHGPGPSGDPAGHAVEPGAQRLAVAEAARLAGQDDEGGLEGVDDVVGVAEEPPADPQDRRAMPGHQRLERRPVAMGREPLEDLPLAQAGDRPSPEELADWPVEWAFPAADVRHVVDLPGRDHTPLPDYCV
jgi:hypothetical protein